MSKGRTFLSIAIIFGVFACSKPSKSPAGEEKTLKKDGNEKTSVEKKEIKKTVVEKKTVKPEKPVTEKPLEVVAPGVKVKVDKDALNTTIKGNRNFTFNVLKLLEDKKTNLFFSPASILSAMAMTYNGSSGSEKKEFEKVLGFDADYEKNSAAVNHMYDYSDVKGKFKLTAANRIFVSDSFKLREPFLKLNATYFSSSIQRLDFKDPGKAVGVINKWVEDKTSRLIKDLVKKEHITEDTRLLLVNAIYMKADWLSQFKKTNSWDGKFNGPDGKTKVRYMTQTAYFKSGSLKDGDFLEMEYSGRRLSMVIALPEKGSEPLKFIQKMDGEKLNKAISGLKSRKTSVTIPKFSFEKGFSLKKVLIKLGMPVSFSDMAKFKKMAFEDLKIQDVIHKARVDVDEKGTEAAAATAVIMMKAGGMPIKEEIFHFTADRPFVFFIRDTLTGHIIFAGVLNNPEYKK
ncbi:hypothetical protein KKF34_17915 [Myxococcota bacterium]|nr:hypothetical protein [Myxococcota bacterium]MBU1379876.1 hypothetical protein [Myxococcota bacterium]MBU1498761.1 hypothetical protein [Myxococcota bacterium]